MSLTSYRAAPSRATNGLAFGRTRKQSLIHKKADLQRSAFLGESHQLGPSNSVNGFMKNNLTHAPATKPGDVLLFQRLSGSTIGADWFHGRVRDGIGWVTVAMATKL
jgi:hypothetical protein